MIRIKRIYAPPAADDGFRILVDRLWPRGLSKEKAKIGLWLRDIAPSNELRKWYCHDLEKWGEFKQRYFKEIGLQKEPIDILLKKAKEGKLTLLFGSKEEKLNNAVALKEFLERKLRRKNKT